LIHTGAARSALSQLSATPDGFLSHLRAAFFLLPSTALIGTRTFHFPAALHKIIEWKKYGSSRVNFAKERTHLSIAPLALAGNLPSYRRVHLLYMVVLSFASRANSFLEEEREILPNGTGTLHA
jgi:hypothetical protein